MIASIQGILDTRRAGYIIVRVGGFGIRVFSPTTSSIYAFLRERRWHGSLRILK